MAHNHPIQIRQVFLIKVLLQTWRLVNLNDFLVQFQHFNECQGLLANNSGT